MRIIINDSEDIVSEMIEGIIGAYPGFYENPLPVNCVISRERKKNKVALVIGGGSGHEPLFAGFVGHGLADASACGNMFASPDPSTIYQAARYVDQGSGVVLLFNNYPGDAMTFKMGEEQLKEEGISAECVCVTDDVASASILRKEERRGIAGEVFVIKIAGAACEEGLPLQDVVRIARKANDNVRSIGVATYSFLGGNQEPLIDYGVGLTGERGILRTKIESANNLVDKMFFQIMSEDYIHAGDEVCVLVNGLGATSLTELLIVFRRLKKRLKKEGIYIYDSDVKNYCTGKKMDGFSISLMKLDTELKALYDKPCFSPFYQKNIFKHEGISAIDEAKQNTRQRNAASTKVSGKKSYVAVKRQGVIQNMDVLLTRDMMIYVADKLMAAKDMLSELDAVVGDGDHGICMAGGMKKVKRRLKDINEKDTISQVFVITGKTMLITMGGMSGVLFGNMFLEMAEVVKNKDTISTQEIAQMWRAGLSSVKERGGAQPGDKTMVDALEPAVNSLEKSLSKELMTALWEAEKAAQAGVESTKNMVSKHGKGKYYEKQSIGCQDAGATSIWLIFQSMLAFVEGII